MLEEILILRLVLFTIFVDWVIKNVIKTPHVIQWFVSNGLENLDFVDDITLLLTKRESDVHEKLRRLHYGA